MRMDDDMDRRLQNWARWRHMCRGGGHFSAPSIEARVDGLGHDAPTVIPTSDAEAEDTEAGVMALDSVLRAAVESWYLGSGGVAARCKRLCCSETTLRTRIGLAHAKLSEWLCARHARRQDQRARVDALQRSAVLLRRGV